MRQNRLAAALLTLAAGSTATATTLGAAPTASASSQTFAAEAASSDFYTPPAQLPAGNGTLVRSEPLQTLLNLYGTTTRIMYTSTDTNGARVAVTGAYVEPWARWTGPGQRPVVALASGTIGQGDQCAPSKQLQSAVSINAGPSFGLNYEWTAMNNLLSKGVAVVLTDYIGLGTPDRVHTYMNRLDQAHAVLDAARAARSVPGSSVKADSKVATYGYSQGGGASGAAAELAGSYAPDLDVVGSYVGAPPADLAKTLPGIDGSTIAGVAGYVINGMVSEYPQLKPFVDDNINDAGRKALAATSQQCIADSLFTYGFHQTKEWTKSGEPLGTLIARNPEVESIVDRQKLGTVAPKAPVRVATGIYDDIVPHAQAKQLAEDWCALGADVTYAPISGLNLGNKTALNHLAPTLTDSLAARDWIVDRLSGKPTTPNCAAVPSMK